MIVDAEDYEVFTHLHCSYVKSQRCTYATVTLLVRGQLRTKRVHRLIAHTGPNQVCHHRNRNSMDNRYANLLNMTAKAHDHLHKNNNLLIKYQKVT